MWTGESEYFPIRWRSKFVFILLPINKPIWRYNSNNRAYLPPLSHPLWRMRWIHFIAEEPWVLQRIRIPADTCATANSIWIPYVWTGKFLNPERKRCGFKNIRIRVEGLVIRAKFFPNLSCNIVALEGETHCCAYYQVCDQLISQKNTMLQVEAACCSK